MFEYFFSTFYGSKRGILGCHTTRFDAFIGHMMDNISDFFNHEFPVDQSFFLTILFLLFCVHWCVIDRCSIFSNNKWILKSSYFMKILTILYLCINWSFINTLNDFSDVLNIFPRQSLKIFTFLVKLSDSIFFLFGLSPIVKLI